MKEISQVLPGLKMIVPPAKPGSAWESPNLYLVGDGPLTLIDAGYDRELELELVLAAAGPAPIERIILTHGHGDHAGAAWRLRKRTHAPVLIHPADFDSIQVRFPGMEPDGAIVEGDRFTAGGYQLEVLHLPGHSPGHVGLLERNRGLLFAGDLVTGSGSTLVAPPEGNMKTYMASLRRVQTLALKKLLPGHGPIRDDPQPRVAELIEHRELRELCLAKCLASAGAPIGLNDLVKAMYIGLIHPQMIGPAAWTAWAHLEKLIDDGVVEKSSDGGTNPFQLRFGLVDGAQEKILALGGERSSE